MNTSKLQDNHTDEVRRFVQEIRDYIDTFQVKVILDIGSRDACESITLKDFFPNATVYAFECNPPAVELCRKNIGNRTDIILVAKAVADVNGTLDFFAIDPEKTVTSHADGNIGASSLFIANPDYPYEKYHQRKITVESITLKRWAQQTGVNDVDIIWVDLQGAELKAFKGMSDLIRRVKVIYTEVEFEQMYIGQPLFRQVDRYLAEKGFFLLRVDCYGWFGNALYVHSDLIRGRNRLAKLHLRKYSIYGHLWASRLKSRTLHSLRGLKDCIAKHLLSK